MIWNQVVRFLIQFDRSLMQGPHNSLHAERRHVSADDLTQGQIGLFRKFISNFRDAI